MTEIDDEMVERAVAAYMSYPWGGPPYSSRGAMRAAIAAALAYRAMRALEAKAQERNPFGVRLYCDKNDRRQNGCVVMTDRRVGDRRGRGRFLKANS